MVTELRVRHRVRISTDQHLLQAPGDNVGSKCGVIDGDIGYLELLLLFAE
jgi:hypothetical protein